MHTANMPLDIIGPVELLGAEEAGELPSYWPVQKLVALEVRFVGKGMQANRTDNALEWRAHG